MANPKFSKAGKMPCRSWSLEAQTTCPGSIDPDTKKLVPACQGCYATDGNYRFKNVKAPRLHNRDDWKSADWIDAMVSALDNDRYFRLFDSGDFYHHKLAEKWLSVMEQTPWVKYWVPTRSYKIPRIAKILVKMAALPNVVVRYSSDSVRGEFEQHHGSTIIGEDQIGHIDGVTVCHAYSNDGKCGTCRSCWNKDINTIAYVQHGRKMKKVNSNLIAKG